MDAELRARTRAAYDTVAASYARMLPDVGFEAPLDLAMVQHFVREVRSRGGVQVLDAGCGTGRMIAHLHALDGGLEMTGVDLSPVMAQHARDTHPLRRIEVGDLAALPFDDGRFDGVLAWYSIIHLPPHELPAVLRELRRMLRPGGLVLLGFHAGSGERAAQHAYGHDVQLRTFLHATDEVGHALRTAGLEPIATLERSARESERHGQGFVLARLV